MGQVAEQAVCNYLRALQWEILATNYRCPAGEIDIVAREQAADGPVLVFVEVKARSGTAFGSALSAVTLKKQQKLAQCALHFLGEYPQGNNEPHCRFDIAAATMLPANAIRVELHRAAFTA